MAPKSDERGVGTVNVVSRSAELGTELGGVCPSADERLNLFGLLLETNARLERQLGQALEDAIGLPLPWFEVLLRVKRADGGFLSMTSLATQTVYSSGGTTRLIDRIEAQGLVERAACPSDRRSVHVRLTSLGDETLARAIEVHVVHLDEFVNSKLTAEECEQLASSLRKLNGGPPACGA
jgi:MarR family transcriptional regulator, 2-MHQ and catechol-resistance regulon repressor